MSLKPASARELQQLMEAERAGQPFLHYRDESGEQRVVALGPEPGHLSVGRGESNDVSLPWDTQVSRVHCELVRIGGEWAVSDDGLSRNGTFVNEERVGATQLAVRGFAREVMATAATPSVAALPPLTERQRAILRALARPFLESEGLAAPATNQTVADEVNLSVDAIKGHLRVLYARFGLDHLAQHEKRLRLAERAIRDGLVQLR